MPVEGTVSGSHGKASFQSLREHRGYYAEVLREFRKRFLGKRPALFKSVQWHFHQDNALVHNSILVTYYLTKMGIKTVPQPPLLHVTFGYSLSSEAVVMRQLKRWKRLWLTLPTPSLSRATPAEKQRKG